MVSFVGIFKFAELLRTLFPLNIWVMSIKIYKKMYHLILCMLPAHRVWRHRCYFTSIQFSSVAQSCLTLCDPIDCSMPGLHVHHRLLELSQTHAHWVGDAIQPFHPLSSPSVPTFNLSQHQGLFKWVSSSHQVAKVLEFQLQHQSFQWTPRTDLL